MLLVLGPQGAIIVTSESEIFNRKFLISERQDMIQDMYERGLLLSDRHVST